VTGFTAFVAGVALALVPFEGSVGHACGSVVFRTSGHDPLVPRKEPAPRATTITEAPGHWVWGCRGFSPSASCSAFWQIAVDGRNHRFSSL
jgi:hypothetical protein